MLALVWGFELELDLVSGLVWESALAWKWLKAQELE